MIRRAILVTAALGLSAGCSGETAAPSAEQDRDMNEAAELLEKAPTSLSNVDDQGLEAAQASGEAPAEGGNE